MRAPARIAGGRICALESQNLDRSLKEAAGELEARLVANNDRRFPVMGLRGAAGALMLREMALRLRRPIVAITSLAAEAEALAGEAAFFLSSRSTLMPPRAACIFFARGKSADGAIVAAARRASCATRRAFRDDPTASCPDRHFGRSADDADDSAVEFQRIDRPAVRSANGSISTQSSMRSRHGLSAGAADRRAGRFQRARRNRRRVLAALSAIQFASSSKTTSITSIRHFDAPSQQSLGEVTEATITRTRYVPPSALRDKQLRDRVALRCRRNRDGAQGDRRTDRDARERHLVSRRRTADAATLRAASSKPYSTTCRPTRSLG